MTRSIRSSLLAVVICVVTFQAFAEDVSTVREESVAGPQRMAIKVRMEGPYTAEVPLQIVCYFKYTEDGAKRMSGAPIELDKRLGGIIQSLRTKGEFQGNELEALVLRPKPGTIKAESLLLIGLGDESKLSLETMERVGRAAFREAKNLGATKVAFAPLIRDQGNSTLPAGSIQAAVVRGLLLADKTERHLEADGFSDKYELAEWRAEAGPSYFDETVRGVRDALVASPK